MKREELDELHYITPIANIVSILSHGILSHRLASRLRHESVAMQEVQDIMYEDYVLRCQAKQVRLGEPYLYRRSVSPWILNFPTKDHWRSVSRLSDIVAGLEYLERHYREWGITSLAVPALGCNNGQLEWRVVGPTLYRYLSRLGIPVELYAPLGTA